MRWSQARTVLEALSQAGVPCWVAGGWGVAALVGRQTREHRDLDLLVDAGDLEAALGLLAELGYHLETDRLPVGVEVCAGPGQWVEVHPVVFGADGHGVQAGPDGAELHHRAESFTLGTIRGYDVPCLTASHQRDLHRGYAHREQDLHDLAQLDRAGL